MKKKTKLLALILASMLTVSSTVGCSLQGKQDKENDSEVSETESSEDKKSKEKKSGKDIRPQDNFYESVNFDTLMNTDIPYGEKGYSTWGDEEVEEQVNDIIREIVNSSERFKPGSNEQLINDLYNQYIEYKDDGSAEKEIMTNCQRIFDSKDINELFEVWGDLVRNYGASSVFQFSVMLNYQNGSENVLFLDADKSFLGTPLEDIADLTSNCQQPNALACDMLRIMGDDYDTAHDKGKDMAYLAIDIANNTDFEEGDQFEKIMTLEKTSFDEFDSIMSNINGSVVEMFFGDVKDSTDGVYIMDKKQLEAINSLITDKNLEKWKNYIYADYIFKMGAFIPDSHEILKKYYPESKETDEKLGQTCIKNYLPNELSEIYTEKYYTPEIDKGIHDMVDDIKMSYTELINNADWLSADMRKSLKKKLDNIELITATKPHKVKADDAKLIGDDLYATVRNITKRSIDKQISDLSEKPDHNNPEMTAQTLNAQYLPYNAINITVAIMQKSMFDPNGDEAENLGRLGAVVSHEIGHAFDSTCINFDEDGVYNPNWISEDDKKALDERADSVASYYDKYTIMEVFHVDGELTKGENYADLSGVECVTNLVDDEEELKKLFESYAKMWAMLQVDTSALHYLKADVHSPNGVRVNAVLSSNEKFIKVYNIKEGDGMYVAPEERVSRW
ncbi:MAG: M13 family metallopeptidase [Ruminococcus sp.]|nr:M13 family metallopeptidase [Ruminococcus sp.]